MVNTSRLGFTRHLSRGSKVVQVALLAPVFSRIVGSLGNFRLAGSRRESRNFHCKLLLAEASVLAFCARIRSRLCYRVRFGGKVCGTVPPIAGTHLVRTPSKCSLSLRLPANLSVSIGVDSFQSRCGRQASGKTSIASMPVQSRKSDRPRVTICGNPQWLFQAEMQPYYYF